jgi:hypothetical protein
VRLLLSSLSFVTSSSLPSLNQLVSLCTVTALYDYDSTGPDELSLVSGQRFELTDVGFDYGEGWAEGRQDGRGGVFPSNYVERS